MKRKPNYYFTIVSVALVLFLFGLFGLIVLNANALMRYFKENIEVSIEIKSEAEQADVLALRQALGKKGYLKSGSLEFITKEEGAAFMKDAFGDDFVKYGLENPLLDVIRFNLNAKYLTPKKLREIKSDLETNPTVEFVFYEEVQVESVENNIIKLGGITLFIGLFFAIVTYVLINNTVRLALYSNRFTIKNMQLVGATSAFISKPYLRRGLLNGFISGLIAVIGLSILSFWIFRAYPELILFQDWVNLLILSAIVLTLGISISVLSTVTSVNKYLKMPIEELY